MVQEAPEQDVGDAEGHKRQTSDDSDSNQVIDQTSQGTPP
jgi:hypothetical protein